MHIFTGWQDYEKRLADNWRRLVTPDDTVVIAGDISWGMNLSESLPDFAFLDALPGRKLILKGNHDYWWSTKRKADDCFRENGFETLSILFNNAYRVGDTAVCGTRGWLAESCAADDRKVLLREAGRLRMSLDAAKALGGEPVVFFHYPPISAERIWCPELFEVLSEAGVRRCYYGHLHGPSCHTAFNGTLDGIALSLISCDYLGFCPKLVDIF